jgi:hypothetical protein
MWMVNIYNLYNDRDTMEKCFPVLTPSILSGGWSFTVAMYLERGEWS